MTCSWMLSRIWRTVSSGCPLIGEDEKLGENRLLDFCWTLRCKRSISAQIRIG